jgi:hypothetical protein
VPTASLDDVRVQSSHPQRPLWGLVPRLCSPSRPLVISGAEVRKGGWRGGVRCPQPSLGPRPPHQLASCHPVTASLTELEMAMGHALLHFVMVEARSIYCVNEKIPPSSSGVGVGDDVAASSLLMSVLKCDLSLSLLVPPHVCQQRRRSSSPSLPPLSSFGLPPPVQLCAALTVRVPPFSPPAVPSSSRPTSSDSPCRSSAPSPPPTSLPCRRRGRRTPALPALRSATRRCTRPC